MAGTRRIAKLDAAQERTKLNPWIAAHPCEPTCQVIVATAIHTVMSWVSQMTEFTRRATSARKRSTREST